MKLITFKRKTLAVFTLFTVFSGLVSAGGNLSEYDSGNPGEVITRRWDERMMPIDWVFSDNGHPGSIYDNAEIISEFTAAFDTWESITTSHVRFNYDGEIDFRISNDDGKNLVTFTDSDIEFPPGVAGFAVTYSFVQETIIDDTNNDMDGDGVADIPNGTYPAGTIYDGNIIFNSSLNYSTSGADGTLDIRAIALHEVGHLMGLSHSSIEDAVMWPFLNADVTQARTPSEDDVAFSSYTYIQEPAYSAQFGSITGFITNGFTGFPILGAHVYAVDVDSGEKLVGAYSGPDGSYSLPIQAGSYFIGIEPLDGDPAALDPERINDVIAATPDTNFIEELFDANESSIEADPLAAIPVTVSAGSVTTDINLQTNTLSVPGISRVLRPGINYFSFPVAIPSGLSAYALLQTLGNEAEINALERLNTDTQLFERVNYVNGVPSGKDFPIRRGEGYIVHAQQQKVVTFYGIPDCPVISLAAGLNLIAVPCPPATYSAFDLLEHLGTEHEVVALKRFDPETSTFQIAEYISGEASGDDFFIVNGEAYFTELRLDKTNVSVPGIGSIFPPAIISISPGRGLVNDLVVIQGEGFAENILDNSVTFNGAYAHVIYSSRNVIATSVPATAVSGPVVVTSNGRESNAVVYIVESDTVIENSTNETEILPGQNARGRMDVIAEQDRYTFLALNGALANISAETVSGTADLMIILEGPSGVILASDDDSGPGNSPAIRNFSLPETGLYTVVVTAVSGTGDYSLSVDVLNTTSAPAISVLQGDTQSTLAGADLPQPLEVYVTSSTGQPLVGVPVTFTANNVDVAAVSQGFSLQNAGTTVVTTNGNGIATVEATAPNMNGVFDIVVTVPGMDPVTMQVSTISSAVSEMIISNQVVDCGGSGCEVGRDVDSPYSILYLDSVGQPVENVFTEWHVVSGNGSLDDFNPVGIGRRHLTDASGRVQVVHELGEKLYAEVNGEPTSIKMLQVVAASVPGQSAPVLFSAVSRAGPAASIESLKGNYIRKTIYTISLRPVVVRVADRFGNPVAGALLDIESDDLLVIPGLEDGVMQDDYTTNEDGVWVGAIDSNDMLPTMDERGWDATEGLADRYQITISEPTAGSVSIGVDMDMGPKLVDMNPLKLEGFVSQTLDDPVVMRLVRFKRFDGPADDDDLWTNEGFDRIQAVSMGDIDIRVSVMREDFADTDVDGVVPTTVNGESEVNLITEDYGLFEVEVVLGDVGGATDIIAEVIAGEVFSYILVGGGPIYGDTPYSPPLENFRTSAVVINIVPVEVRATIDADALSGLDWTTLQITLNGSTTVFDGSDEMPPVLRSYPNFIRVYIDGAEQLIWPSAELIAAGGFAQLEIVYQPLGSDLIEGVNTLAVTADVIEFDGSVTSTNEQNSFIFNDDLTNRLWETTHSFDAEADFTSGRRISLAQMQGQAADPAGISIGSFEVFNVPLSEPSTVQVDILDGNKNQVGTLISATTLTAGMHNFVLLREDINNNIVPLSGKPDLFLRVETTPNSTGLPRVKMYAGDLEDSVSGKMLGQVIQHDTLVHDGSLTLRREDLALKGAGPQLSFIRSYSNSRQPENTDSDLGPGWTHNHNIFIKVLSWSDIGPDYGENLPSWIAGTRAGFSPRFLTSEALTTLIQASFPQAPSIVTVSNGGTFNRNGSVWTGQRGNHGRLSGNLGSGYVYTSKDGTVYIFNLTSDNKDRFKIASVADRNGNTLTYEYNNNQLSRVEDQAGRYLEFNYGRADNGRNRITTVRAEVDSLNTSQNIELIFNYFKRESTDPDEMANHFDEVGMLQSFTREDFVERYDYDAVPGDREPNLILVEDPNGHKTQYQYLARADVPLGFSLFSPGTPRTELVHRICYPTDDETCSDNFAQIDYSVVSGNVRTVTDLRGNTTRYVLNRWGNPIRIEEPEGKITEFDWSINLSLPDNLMRAKRELAINATWAYEYDSQGNLTLETDPFNETVVQVWNQEFSVLTSRIDKNGNRFTQTLDGNGNVRIETREAYIDGVTTPTNVTVEHIYNNLAGFYGMRRSTTDGRGNTTLFAYDNFGNLSNVTEPGNIVTNYENNARGLRTSVRDPNNNLTTYEYDSLDRLTLMTDAELNTVENDYDAKGNKISEVSTDSYTIDSNTHTRMQSLEYEYDERDRVVEVRRSGNVDDNHPIGGLKVYAYDGNSNLLSESDWKGVNTTHTYDELNRRTVTTNRLGDSMSHAYAWIGSTGLRKTMTDYEGHQTVEHHDRLGRLLRVEYETVNHSDGSSNDYARVFTYDNHENVTSILDQENTLTRYEYDPRYLKVEQINALGDSYFWEYDANGNVTKTIDEESSETTFVYDDQNRLSEKLEPESHTWTYRYYPNDTLRAATDPWGFEHSYTYDKINQRTGITDPDGRTLESYSKNGERVYRQDAEGRVTSTLYGPEGRVQISTDARGRSTTNKYDHNNNLVDTELAWTDAATGPQSVKGHYVYDALDRVTQLHEAFETSVERQMEYQYDRQSNKVSEISPEGRVMSYGYDELYRVTTITTPATNDNLNTDTLQKFNGVGKLVWTQDRRDNISTIAYDDLHRAETLTDALNQTIVNEYDRVSNITKVTDKRGHSHESVYDDLYRVTEQFIDDNDGTRFRLLTNEYDIDNTGNGVHRVAVTDANNNRVLSNIDFRGNTTQVTLPAEDGGGYAQGFVESAYDTTGLLLSSTDAADFVTTYSYFDDGTLASVINAENDTTTYQYDIFGNQVVVTNPKLFVQTSIYDARNRLVEVEDHQSNRTRFEYDVNSNLRHQYSPAARNSGSTHVEYTYDVLNRKRSHIQHKSGANLITSYVYDAEGNLTRLWDASRQIFTNTYDVLNRLATEQFPVGDDITSIVHTYDENNNPDVVTETKPSGIEVSNYDYDLLDRLVTHVQRGHAIAYSYDNNGNRTSVTAPGGSTTYTFDTRNRLQTATAAGAATDTLYSYLQNGWLDLVAHANNTSVDYDYYNDGQTQTITNRSAAALVSRFAYQYDANNNRTQQIETQNSFASAQVLTTDYGYDSLDRLESYTETAGDGTHNASHTFTYFPSYDRRTEVVVENATTLKDRSFTYDNTYWLSRIVENAGSGGTIQYTYDDNGNTLTKLDTTGGEAPASTLFSYNRRNQLKTFASGDVDAEVNRGTHDYNYTGMRIRHLNSDRGDIEYIYDDNSIIDEVQNGTTTSVAHYRYGDRLLSLDSSGQEQFYHYASLGTTANLSDSAGVVQVSYRVDPFGEITEQEGVSVNRQVFTGHEHDEETGLIYMKARFYDPDVGRFLNQDTYLGENGTPPSLHRYLYAYSNPNVFVDLDGYTSTCFSDGTSASMCGGRATKSVEGGELSKPEEKVDDGLTGGERSREFWMKSCSDKGGVDCSNSAYNEADKKKGLEQTARLTAESEGLNKPNQTKSSPSEDAFRDIVSPDGFVDQEALDNLRRAKAEGDWKEAAKWSAILAIRFTKQGEFAEQAKDFIENPSLDSFPTGRKKKRKKDDRQDRQYHTKFKVVLDEGQYFDSDGKQFRFSNKKLIRKLRNDPNFRKKMFKKYSQLKRWMKDTKKHSSSPPGLTWHHDEAPGVLKLVNRRDHSKQNGIYHPEGKGGREIWGGGEAGRRGHLSQDGTIKEDYRNLYE